MQLKRYVREIPDFPKKGINFKDITPLLANPKTFRTTINQLLKPYKNKKITKVVGVLS